MIPIHAGFWRRMAAFILDSLLLAVPQTLLNVAIGGNVALLLNIAIAAGYFAGMHSSAKQATLGKMAFGIKVTDMYGARISVGRATGRYFATWLSAIILFIGYFMAAFTDRKRALHDMIASTLVVDQWAFTAHPERQNPELGTVTKVIVGIFVALIAGYFLLIIGLLGLGAAMS